MLVGCFGDYLASLNIEFMQLRRSLCEEIVECCKCSENPTADLEGCLYLIEAVMSSSLEAESLRMMEEKLLFNFVGLSLKEVRSLSVMLRKEGAFCEQERESIEWVLRVHKITHLLFVSAKIEKLYVLKFNIIVSNELAQYIIECLRLSRGGETFMVSSVSCPEYKSLN
jgi:hypothetical protein